MLETGLLPPRMIRRITLAGKNIRIIWSQDETPHIPAEDLAPVIGVEIDTILGYADSPAMQFEWLRFEIQGQPAGVVCISLSAVPCLLTALALQMRESDPPNHLLEWIAQDALDTLAKRWHLGDPKTMRQGRLDAWLQVADAFGYLKGDVDAIGEAPPSLG